VVKAISAGQKHHLQPSRFWGIRQKLPKRLGFSLTTVVLAGILLLWALLSYSKLVPPEFLPSPTATLQAAIILFRDEKFLVDILESFLRVGGGFLAASLIGIPLGIAIGTFGSIESLLNPIVVPMRYVPIVALMPLIVLWVGLGEEAKILIIFLGIVFFNIIMIADAVKFIPNEMLNVAYTLGATRQEVVTRVILPGMLPSIIDTLRVNVAGAWNYLVVAELLAAENGVGYVIVKAQRFLQTEKVLVGIVVISLIGLAIDTFFKLLARLVTPWAEHTSHSR
jgi:NitT/TauT family transport system permease protein